MNITYKLCLIFLFSLILNNLSYAKPENEDNQEESTETIETIETTLKTTEQDEIHTEEEKEEQEVTEDDDIKISKKAKKKGTKIKMYQSQQQEAEIHHVEEPDDSDDSDTNSNSKRLQLAPEKPIKPRTTTPRTKTPRTKTPRTITVSPTFTDKKITSYPIKMVAVPTFKSLFNPLPGLPAFEPMSMSMNFLPFSGNNTFPMFEPIKSMQSIKNMMSNFPSLYPTKPPNNAQLTTASDDNT